MKTRLLAVSLILLAGVSSAQTQDFSLDTDPGLVKADSPIYGLEVAFDNALVSAGLASPGDVAFERASEVAVASERNNTEAFEDAVERFGSVADRADNGHRERLEQAERVLGNVSERVPEEAEFGIQNALNKTRQAMERVPDQFSKERGGALPDVKLPEGPSGDLEVPGGKDSSGR